MDTFHPSHMHAYRLFHTYIQNIPKYTHRHARIDHSNYFIHPHTSTYLRNRVTLRSICLVSFEGKKSRYWHHRWYIRWILNMTRVALPNFSLTLYLKYWEYYYTTGDKDEQSKNWKKKKFASIFEIRWIRCLRLLWNN